MPQWAHYEYSFLSQHAPVREGSPLQRAPQTESAALANLIQYKRAIKALNDPSAVIRPSQNKLQKPTKPFWALKAQQISEDVVLWLRSEHHNGRFSDDNGHILRDFPYSAIVKLVRSFQEDPSRLPAKTKRILESYVAHAQTQFSSFDLGQAAIETMKGPEFFWPPHP
ncbi:unnamed protein product [Bursaphelenchus xylophilus]|uniref:(pine wood nematode) hypothetical protein n=1 Tax=Bursaphelenchus xylophilus TaxID=6326 RepID=A0A1I7RUL2_BURXY|nr:unnamed protein product [Bursaphelenchus xylophilus]CAG9114199.1 unnamed protein product [Bursaphelenchus xylophilus]